MQLNPIGLANLNAIFAGFCGSYSQESKFTENAIHDFTSGDMQWAAELCNEVAQYTPLQVGVCAMPEHWAEMADCGHWPNDAGASEMLGYVYDDQLAAGTLLRYMDPANPEVGCYD